MQKIKLFLKKSRIRGFSMVGVLTAGGLMGGLSLFLAQMAKEQHKTQKRAETGVEITALSNLVVNTLSDGVACKNTVESGGSAPAISPGAAVTVPELRGKGTPLSASRILLESGKTYGNRLVKISSMRLVVPAGATIVDDQTGGDFEVVFERVSRVYTGQKTVTKSFPVTLELDPSNSFKGCRSTFDSVAMEVKKKICSELGGVWTDATGKCGKLVAGKVCPAGRIMEGFDSGGNVRCVASHANRRCAGKVVTGFDSNGVAECVSFRDVVKGMGCGDGEVVGFDSGGDPACVTLTAGLTPSSNPGPNPNPVNPNPGNPVNPSPSACPAGYDRSTSSCQAKYRKGGLQYADEDRICNANGTGPGSVSGVEKWTLTEDSGDSTCRKCAWKTAAVTCGNCATTNTCGKTSCDDPSIAKTCAELNILSRDHMCQTGVTRYRKFISCPGSSCSTTAFAVQTYAFGKYCFKEKCTTYDANCPSTNTGNSGNSGNSGGSKPICNRTTPCPASRVLKTFNSATCIYKETYNITGSGCAANTTYNYRHRCGYRNKYVSRGSSTLTT